MLKSALLATGLGVGWLAMTPGASGQYLHVCSNATIAGQYGFQDSGSREVDGKSFQFDAVRTASSRGKGSMRGTDTSASVEASRRTP